MGGPAVLVKGRAVRDRRHGYSGRDCHGRGEMDAGHRLLLGEGVGNERGSGGEPVRAEPVVGRGEHVGARAAGDGDLAHVPERG